MSSDHRLVKARICRVYEQCLDIVIQIHVLEAFLGRSTCLQDVSAFHRGMLLSHRLRHTYIRVVIPNEDFLESSSFVKSRLISCVNITADRDITNFPLGDV